jgi:hypothetical protein
VPAVPSARAAPTITPERAATLAARARAWVTGRGKATGFEHLVAYDLRTGRQIACEQGTDRDAVKIPDKVRAAASDPAAAVEIHHNHPDNLAPSPYDLSRFAEYPGLRRIHAYGHDGSTFSVTALRRGGIPSAALDAASIELVKQLRTAGQRNLYYRGMEAHLQTLALQRAGLIDYSYRLDPDRAAFLVSETGAIDAIVNAIADAIRRVL